MQYYSRKGSAYLRDGIVLWWVEGGDQSSLILFRKGKDMRKNDAINLPVVQTGTYGKSFEL